MKSIFASILAAIGPVKAAPPPVCIPDVRKEAAATAMRLRASRSSSLEAGAAVRATMRPLEALLREMGDDREDRDR